jgi:acetyl-CoA acetyltransferase
MSVAIVGAAELPQGRSTLPTTMALHEELCRRATEDAGIRLEDLDLILTVSPRSDPYLIHATALAEHLGIHPALAMTLEAGGAAPAAMVDVARGLIANGTAQTALIVAADMPLSSVTRDAYVNTLTEAGPVHPDLERPFGPSVPSLFALVAQSYMDRYGATADHFAAVALQNRRSAQLHPNAHMREPLDADAYYASRMIAEPLRLLDCAPVSDGGGAVVLTSAERARDLPAKAVHVLGAGFSTGHMHLSAASSLTVFQAGEALQRALGQAGCKREDIDLALVYDCFTIAMLVNLEDMGFAERGGAGRAFLEGRFASGSRVPVNTHGGLLSHGHPARAGGMGNLIEAVVQLRGEAGDRQKADAALAMVHGMGGAFANHGVVLLGRS